MDVSATDQQSYFINIKEENEDQNEGMVAVKEEYDDYESMELNGQIKNEHNSTQDYEAQTNPLKESSSTVRRSGRAVKKRTYDDEEDDYIGEEDGEIRFRYSDQMKVEDNRIEIDQNSFSTKSENSDSEYNADELLNRKKSALQKKRKKKKIGVKKQSSYKYTQDDMDKAIEEYKKFTFWEDWQPWYEPNKNEDVSAIEDVDDLSEVVTNNITEDVRILDTPLSQSLATSSRAPSQIAQRKNKHTEIVQGGQQIKEARQLQQQVKTDKATSVPGPPKRTRNRMYNSKVWHKDAFSFRLGPDGVKDKKVVICSQCPQEYTYSAGTGNMKNHMRNKHPIVWKSISNGERVALAEPPATYKTPSTKHLGHTLPAVHHNGGERVALAAPPSTYKDPSTRHLGHALPSVHHNGGEHEALVTPPTIYKTQNIRHLGHTLPSASASNTLGHLTTSPEIVDLQQQKMQKSESMIKSFMIASIVLAEKMTDGVEQPEALLKNFNCILENNGHLPIQVPQEVLDSAKIIYQNKAQINSNFYNPTLSHQQHLQAPIEPPPQRRQPPSMSKITPSTSTPLTSTSLVPTQPLTTVTSATPPVNFPYSSLSPATKASMSDTTTAPITPTNPPMSSSTTVTTPVPAIRLL